MRLTLAALLVALAAPFALEAALPTFYEDVLPIFEKHCLQCHRKDGIAPFRLDNFESARPWAKAIEKAVAERSMPPWLADPAVGIFQNERRLSKPDIEQIERWVGSGAASGRARLARIDTADRYDIGAPDLELTLPRPVAIPARGQFDYQYIVLPQKFAEARWVQAVEVRPSSPGVVHHAVVYIRPPGDTWGSTKELQGTTTNDILAVYTPGNTFDEMPEGMAKRIPAGADLLIQIHYTPNGKATTDQTRIALRFSRTPPVKAIITLQLNNISFRIPAGEANYPVRATGTLPRDAELISLFPHMHLRGKAFEYAIVGERGQYEALLKVPRYDFHWQLSYKLAQPRLLKAGTRVQATGWFDNSKNNPRNPDPTTDVRYGEQSSEEMMIGFFDIAVPADTTKQSYFLR